MFESGDDSARIQTDQLEQVCKNGSIIFTEIVTTLISDSNRKVYEILGITRDNTEKVRFIKQLEEKNKDYKALNEDYSSTIEELRCFNEELTILNQQLAQSENHFRNLVENAPDPIFIQINYKFIYLNSKALSIFNVTNSDELIGKPVMDYFQDNYQDPLAQSIKSLNVEHQSIPLIEEKIITTDGRIIEVEVSAIPYFYNHENGAIVFMRDITQRKKYEKQILDNDSNLKEQNEEYQALNEEYLALVEELNHTIEMMEDSEKALKLSEDLLNETGKIAKIGGWEFDVHTLNGTWTKEVASIHDMDPDADTNAAIGLSFYVDESRVKIENAIHEAIENGIPYDLELELVTAKGNRKWVRTIGQPIKSDNNVVKLHGSFQDITDKVMAKQELLKAKEKAEESDRLKTIFLQNMSHEIRTPMNAIMGFSELLPSCIGNDEKLKEFSHIINQRSSDLLEIINSILDFSRIETGQLPVNLNTFDLNNLFLELNEFFTNNKVRANKENIKFIINPVTDLTHARIETDGGKLKQIFINLIHNAFKFTNVGKIEIGCKFENDGMILFYVSDTGIGISLEKQANIFDRFMQVENSNNLYKGSGLGLAIVKGLVELLGGKIELVSNLGLGSTFRFTIRNRIGS